MTAVPDRREMACGCSMILLLLLSLLAGALEAPVRCWLDAHPTDFSACHAGMESLIDSKLALELSLSVQFRIPHPSGWLVVLSASTSSNVTTICLGRPAVTHPALSSDMTLPTPGAHAQGHRATNHQGQTRNVRYLVDSQPANCPRSIERNVSFRLLQQAVV
jgi:hypothetical protein